MGTWTRITDAEFEEWRRVYPTGGSAAVKALFPHRSMGSIKVNAHKRGLKVNPDALAELRVAPRRHHNSWTPQEDEVIKDLYHAVSMQRLLQLLPGRTLDAIRGRAGFLDVARPLSRVLRVKWEAARESV